jgi:hypothetical protein
MRNYVIVEMVTSKKLSLQIAIVNELHIYMIFEAVTHDELQCILRTGFWLI